MSGSPYVQKRPTVVLVFAILHLVGGGIDLILNLCSAGSLALQSGGGFGGAAGGPGQEVAAQMQRHLESLPGYQAATYGALVLNLVLDGLLLAAGVGLLGMRPWARILSLVYAVFAILNRLATFLYTILVLVPGFESFLQTLAPNQPQAQTILSLTRTMMTVSAVVGLLLMVYPILILIFFNLSSVKAAFRGEAPASLPPALEEDEGWGPVRRPGSTDVQNDPDRERFQPPT